MMHLPDKENIIVYERRHWIVLVSKIIFTLFLIGLILVLAWALSNIQSIASNQFTVQLSITDALGGIEQFSLMVWFGAALIMMILWLQFMVAFTDYFLDVWIVTDQRVLDIEQLGFFNREFSEFRLERVQDVTVDVGGIIATFLHYGDVHVQTAGEDRDFVFRQVCYPHHVKDKILKAVENRMKEKRDEQHRQTREE